MNAARIALETWLAVAARRADPVAAAAAAAAAVRDSGGTADDVVTAAGSLARMRMAPAERTLGLTALATPCSPRSPRAAVVVEAGAPVPTAGRTQRRRRGAWDTSPALAQTVVSAGLRAVPGAPAARDPACGPGRFLVALDRAGVTTLEGADVDPVALAVARVACPRARLVLRSGFAEAEPVPLVVGNPPYVSPEHQDKVLRAELRARFPWLRGRFDLAVPFAEAVLEPVPVGGGLAMLLPDALLAQPYAASLRERWVRRHALTWVEALGMFPGASVRVAGVALRKGVGPAPVPPWGVSATELLGVPGVPWDAVLRPGDAARLAAIAARSVPLRNLAEVDTGVVSHGPLGGKAALLFEEPGPGRVPYVDAADLHAGRVRWLAYRPEVMHRPKRPALFESDKVLLQRICGEGPVRAWLDRDGLFAGHTLTVVRPTAPDDWSASAALAFLRDPLVGGYLRLVRGVRLDLYPRDVGSLPVPRTRTGDLETDWGLTAAFAARLRELAPR